VTTFLLVRHGDTDALQRILAGSQPGWVLNATGREQARRLGAQLSNWKLDAVYTSPLERTRETAIELAAPHGFEPRDSEALREMNFGSWEGKSFADLKVEAEWLRFNQLRSEMRPPGGGESMSEVQSRVVNFVEQLCERHGNSTIALVSHAEPLRLLIGHWLNIPFDYVRRLSLDPASVSLVKVWDHWTEVLCVNVKGELVI
jgi:broad specificity phosphatase PhoE